MRPPADGFAIRRPALTDAAAFRSAVADVASERTWLATVDGFALEQVQAFLLKVVEADLPQLFAEADGEIIGWCDILPGPAPGFMHVGTVGMGVRAPWRGRGIGKRLLVQCIALARASALEKIELEVFGDNAPAIRLYQSVGFTPEGARVRGRKLDGRYQDVLAFALWLKSPGA